MRGRAGWLAALLCAGCAGAIPLPIPVPAGPPPPAPGSSAATPSEAALEREIHDRINRHRAGRGLAPLAYDERVAAEARRHSQAMASGERAFGHDGFDARADALARQLPLRGMAENVAYDSRTGAALAQQVVAGWVGSAGHRQNLEGTYQVTGIGVARGRDGVRYFTQIFVARP